MLLLLPPALDKATLLMAVRYEYCTVVAFSADNAAILKNESLPYEYCTGKKSFARPGPSSFAT